MKSLQQGLLILAILFIAPAMAHAQASGDYRSAATGNWGAPATWQQYNGSSWVPAASAPSGSQVITIQSADSVYIDGAVSVSGTLRNQGKLGGSTNLTVASGGTYEHAQNNGSLPEATWAAGSTCLVTGYISGSKPNNSNQNFHHFTWNCANQTSNVDLAMTGNTIGGNFTVMATGTARVYLTSPNAYVDPITIQGNILVSGGQFASNGSSSTANIAVTTMGNITVTGGTFSISRGSGPDVIWTLHGNFSVANATLQNSGGVTRTNKLVFGKAGSQTISLESVAYGSGSSPFTMEVKTGATLNMGTTVITNSNTGSFILQNGATLATANAAGIDGTIQCTGASNGGGNSLSGQANFTFNGAAAQVTGTLMPATVDTLIINNAAGVVLSQATTINRRLRLQAGQFDNTIPFTLGSGATISYEGGTLRNPVTSVDEEIGIPADFYVDQNYPNPFNPSTTIRYGLPVESAVSVRIFNLLGQLVATAYEGRQQAGIHTLKVDASGLSSGVYLYQVKAGDVVAMKRMVLTK